MPITSLNLVLHLSRAGCRGQEPTALTAGTKVGRAPGRETRPVRFVKDLSMVKSTKWAEQEVHGS